ncbi:hypothetical protein ACEWY4_021858 [Coilia grayii]|uniref:Ig-like domain-containing protein n=1 Tax=Coilia grayii TaxID=363190 RepID=A0ABD1J4C6_9TELE
MAASLCVSLIVSLICFNYKGVKGNSIPTLFFSAGGRAVLPCENVIYRNCSSTVWLYSSVTIRGSIEEVAHGQVQQNTDTNRAERLGVDSTCGLVINDVTAEDAGRYTCQHYPVKGRENQGADASVDITVLRVSPLQSVTHIEAGGNVTLQCYLHTHDRCTTTTQGKGLHLSWVDERGKELHTSSNRNIIPRSQCNITISVQLTDLNPSEKQRSWTCQLTADGRVLTSANFILSVKASKFISTPLPVPSDYTGNDTDSSSPGPSDHMGKPLKRIHLCKSLLSSSNIFFLLSCIFLN